MTMSRLPRFSFHAALILLAGIAIPSSVARAQERVQRPPSRVLPGGFVEPASRSEKEAKSAVQTVADENPPAPVKDKQPLPTVAEDWQQPNATMELAPAGWNSFVPYEPAGVCEWPTEHIPNMLSSFVGARTDLLTVQGNELLNALPTDTFDPASLGTGPERDFLIMSPAASVVGRQKAANNNSPIPQNRAFLNYNYLANTSLHDGGVGVHRFTPGIEGVFPGGNFSGELRIPVASTFDSDSILTGGSSRDQLEIGNVHVMLKRLLCWQPDLVLSAGLGATFPTANYLHFFNDNNRELIRVENRAVHLLPFVAGAWSDGGWFVQSFLQLDYDANGNPVKIDNGQGLVDVGDFEDSTYLYFDIGAGYWLIKNRQGGWITGVAPTMELHYNSALDTSEGVRSASGFTLGGNRGQVELVNLLVGATLELDRRHSLALGYALPVGGGDDEQFDAEFRLLFNYYLGGNR